MTDLSFTQEYFLCAVNSKGALPVLSSDVTASCLVAGGIMELTRHGYIAVDGKKAITIAKPLGSNLPYLKPIYDTIESFKKSKKVESVLEAFALSVGLACGRQPHQELFQQSRSHKDEKPRQRDTEQRCICFREGHL